LRQGGHAQRKQARLTREVSVHGAGDLGSSFTERYILRVAMRLPVG
jgi:hypothetical protein